MDDYLTEVLEGSGTSSLECSSPLDPNLTLRASCDLSGYSDLEHHWRVISIVKLVTSSLSVIGSFSVVSAIVLRQKAWREEAHPLLMLCIADFILAGLYLVGGALYLDGDGMGHDLHGCFAISSFTLIMECVTAALTVVYAFFAYIHVKRVWSTKFTAWTQAPKEVAIHPCVTVIIYLLAWVIPVLMVIVPIRIIGERDGTFHDAKSCSCWCIPTFGNILPIAFPHDEPGARYFNKVITIVAVEGGIVGMCFTIAFLLIVGFYYKTLRQIRRITHSYRHYHNVSSAKQTAMLRGQRRARNRITAFIAVFCVTGILNGVFAYVVMVSHAVSLSTRELIRHEPYYYQAYIAQALVVPSQGLLNAIIYGWTRKTFLQATVQRSRGVHNVKLEESYRDSEHGHNYQTFDPTPRPSPRPAPNQEDFTRTVVPDESDYEETSS